MIKATGVILAGGKSARMGVDKAFLKVGRDEMIRRIAEELKKVFAEVLISGGSEEAHRQLGLKVVADLIKGGGPLSGIHATLQCMSYRNGLVVACDMPFINADMARFMINQIGDYDVAVPRHGIHLQPLFAVYSKSCIPAIEESLLASRYKVADFYSMVRVNYVNEQYLRQFADIDFTFFNVNTPSDLNKARVMAVKNGTRRVKIVENILP